MIELHQNEYVILKARKHWFVFFVEAFLVAVMAVVPLVFVPFMDTFFGSIFQVFGAETFALFAADSGTLFTFGYSLWLLFLTATFFVLWTDYYLDVWIVTNQRIFDVEQKGIFRRNISSFQLRRIQDITVETHGILQTLLRFGTIHVQTAGAGRNFEMKGIASPSEVKRIIFKAHEKAVRRYHKNPTENLDA